MNVSNIARELRFAALAIRKNLASSAELRSSFWMMVFGMAVNNVAFLVIWMAFARAVGPIGGWQAIDILAMQGLTALAYGLSSTFFYGIQDLPEKVSSGVFDRFLLSPKNLLLRTATSSLHISALGDILFGVICLTVYIVVSQSGLATVAMFVLFSLSSGLLFFSLLLFSSTLSFYFTDAFMVTRGLFELILLPALMHGGAFQGTLRFVFTFVLPSLALSVLPVEAVKEMALGKTIFVLFMSIFWLTLSIRFFQRSVRRYESANFISAT